MLITLIIISMVLTLCFIWINDKVFFLCKLLKNIKNFKGSGSGVIALDESDTEELSSNINRDIIDYREKTDILSESAKGSKGLNFLEKFRDMD